MRVKAIHVVNVSTPFRFVLNFVTQFLSTKVNSPLAQTIIFIYRKSTRIFSRSTVHVIPHLFLRKNFNLHFSHAWQVRGRLHVHTTRKALQDHIDPSILPSEYSPTSVEGPFDNSWVFSQMCQDHQWFVDRSYFGVQKVEEQTELKRSKSSWFSWASFSWLFQLYS